MKYSIFGINTRRVAIFLAASTIFLAPATAGSVVAHAHTVPAAPSHSAGANASGGADNNVSTEQKALQQSLSPEQPVGTGRTEISSGHVDMGPRFNNGTFELMIHDDHGTTPVWRSADDVLYRGSDQAIRQVPDDERYSFVGAQAGQQVYVIPQTETKGVVWPGWNTQDPKVVSQIPRGVNLTLEAVHGPGQFTLYLENGNFSKPQVLWDSSKPGAQDIWVEKNTHTHANWVFTQPGAYVLKVRAHAELADGSTVTDTRYLKFAIGDATGTEEAYTLAQQVAEADRSADGSASTQAAEVASAGADSSGFPLVPVALGVTAAAVLALIVVVVRRSRAAQAKAERILADTAPKAAGTEPGIDGADPATGSDPARAGSR